MGEPGLVRRTPVHGSHGGHQGPAKSWACYNEGPLHAWPYGRVNPQEGPSSCPAETSRPEFLRTFWKHEPPKPTDAFRNFFPMRVSFPEHIQNEGKE